MHAPFIEFEETFDFVVVFLEPSQPAETQETVFPVHHSAELFLAQIWELFGEGFEFVVNVEGADLERVFRVFVVGEGERVGIVSVGRDGVAHGPVFPGKVVLSA